MVKFVLGDIGDGHNCSKSKYREGTIALNYELRVPFSMVPGGDVHTQSVSLALFCLPVANFITLRDALILYCAVRSNRPPNL